MMDATDQSDTTGSGLERARAGGVAPQGSSGGSCGCDDNAGVPVVPPSYVYALGRIQRRFPTLAVEKEFAQALARVDSSGLTDLQATHALLLRRENRYLARKLCWVLSIEGLETYLLVPRDPSDLDLLIESLRQAPQPTDVDVVIGMRGPIAAPDMCNGLQVPILGFDQIYSFDANGLIKSIPRPESIPQKNFEAAAEELFYQIMQMADNAGSTDEHRALNYLAVRYSAIYAAVAQAHGRGESLAGVEARPSRLTGTRKILDVIFSFVNRATDVTDKSFVRVDVTEEFPFLVSKLATYYDR